MTRTTRLDGPWSLTLASLGDLQAAAAAAEARVAAGLAQPGEGDRVRASAPPDGLRPGVPIPAAIPGCVHLDLGAAGLLADPLRGTHETDQHWIGWSAWTYATTFDAPAEDDGHPDRHELVLAGVAAVATVVLNGEPVAELRNEHRTHRIDVSHRLRPSGNRLELRFPGQAAWAEARRAALGSLPGPYPDPIAFTRRMHCGWGWDWGPTLVTAGIWEPVRIESWDRARIAETRLSATAPGGRPRLRAVVRIDRAVDAPLEVAVRVAGAEATATVAAEGREAIVALEVPDAQRWWPRSHGEAHTYPCEVSLRLPWGHELDRVTRRVGFREVALERRPDASGESFAIRVNGERIWVRGANWIPDDPFPSRVTPERIGARIADAAEAGMDLLRVWGGGRYESEAFYDACDRAGILVWQDFLFGCAAYPEDPDTLAEVEAEARDAIERLGSHPSLALWCGGNETIWGWFDWGWPALVGDRPWGLTYWLELLPRLVAELDPDRPYWPNTPWSGTLERHVNDDRYGTSHLWDVWNDLDYTAYRDRRPRFAAEYGYQAPAAWRTLADAVGAEELSEASPVLQAHQKALDGARKLRRAIDRRFPDAVGFDDRHFLAQLEQARAMSVGVTHLRALGDHCTGSVIWQLNDLWPAISWSLVDAAGRRKPAWYAVRAAYADRLVTIEPALDGPGEPRTDPVLDLAVVNEHPEPWPAEVRVRRVRVDGTVRAEATVRITVPPRSAWRGRVPALLATPRDPGAELLVAETAGAARATWWYREDPELALPAASFQAAVRPSDGGGAELIVTALSLVRELCCFPDRLDPEASVDRMLVTLLPGETATLRVRAPRPIDAAALVAPPVLRAANDGVRQG